ncbi:hypothetical protein BCAR13_120051 [Paraburkholderia caribensis]|nr:hypothetical protein BCAR13_120051 [Paraburkholderia caribensis]
MVVTEVTDNEQHPHDVLKTLLLAETHDAQTRRDTVTELFQTTDERCVSATHSITGTRLCWYELPLTTAICPLKAAR